MDKLSWSNWLQEYSETSQNVLADLIRARVKELLENDFEFLLQSLYRFDVDESAFHAAMALPHPEEVLNQITMLILERELKRQHWRKKYQKELPDSE